MGLALTAVLPLLLLLGLGAVMRRTFLRDGTFWEGLSWMSYWIFTPALFIGSIGVVDLSVVSLGPLLLSLGAPILAVTAVTLVVARVMQVGGPQLTSLVQGSIRINTYIGLVFASALNGATGVATFALASAVVVPLVNLICVVALSVHGDRHDGAERPRLWRELSGNPLILACATGLALNLLPVSVPGVVTATLDMLAAPALACGTLIAGAALRLTLRSRDALGIGIASVLKLAVLPAAAMAVAVPLGMSGAALTSVVLICAVPTAPSAYILASRMGGDTQLIAGITGVQTLAASATMPALLALAHQLAR